MNQSSGWLLSLDPTEPWHRGQCEGLEVASRGHRWVAFHGILYDFSDLAAEVEVTLPATAADIALAAFEKWGPDTARRLRGVFVFAAADSEARTVVVARDPLGSHPLFHATSGGRHLFSESAGALARRTCASVNRAALADHLCHRWPRPEETFFAGIDRVPCGAMARLTPGRLVTERYWSPAPGGDIDWISDSVPERFEHAFTRAIDRTLSFGRSAVFLSGGLDSISVAARAADRTRDRREAEPLLLSLAMDDPACDERATQAGVARTLDLPIRLVRFSEAVGASGLVAPAAGLTRGLSSPLLNTWAPAYLNLAESAANDGVRTILSGTGGDEWLSVSPYLSADLMARGDLSGWLSFYNAFRRSYRHSSLRHLSLAAWTFGGRPIAAGIAARTLGTSWRARRERRVTRHDPEWISPDPELRRQQIERAPGALEDPNPPQGFYVREMTSGLDHPLTSWELEEQYEFGTRLSLRFLHPYWDADLVDVLYRATPSALFAGGRAKGLVRGAMARRFPTLDLGTQRKVPGTGFFQKLLREGMPEAARAQGECRALAELGVIRSTTARELTSAGSGDPVAQWNLVNLEAWVRANGA